MYHMDAPYWQLAKKGMIEARKKFGLQPAEVDLDDTNSDDPRSKL